MKRIVDSFRGFILGLSLIWMPLATAAVAMAQDSTELQRQLAEAQQRNAEFQAKLAELEASMAKGQAVADQLVSQQLVFTLQVFSAVRDVHSVKLQMLLV